MSLQDQLLGAGLVDKKQAAKAKKQKYKKNKQKHQQNKAVVDEAKIAAQKELEQKKERDRLLNLEKETAAQAKAIKAQIKQLINSHHISLTQKGEEGVAFNFQDGKLIKQLFLSDNIQKQLIHGFLAIAKWEEQYFLIPKMAAEKIVQRDASFIVLLNDESTKELQDQESIEDEYADYEIPDDLMW